MLSLLAPGREIKADVPDERGRKGKEGKRSSQQTAVTSAPCTCCCSPPLSLLLSRSADLRLPAIQGEARVVNNGEAAGRREHW